MLVRNTTFIIISVVLASFLAAGSAHPDAAGGKAEMLRVLTQSSRTQIPARAGQAVRTSQDEAEQLVLDLIFYSWASGLDLKTVDVRNIDLLIPSLVRETKDQTAAWAAKFFSDAKPETALPPREDDRVQKLFDLKTRYKSALDFRKSSPIQAAAALQSAAGLCQDLHLDLGEALVLKQLGDCYLYDMARYSLAEACYERAAWTFPTYRCWAASANVYDDFGYLNAETGRYATATEYYIESARHWEQLANQGYKYRDMAGREYVKAGILVTDYPKALALMRTKGIGQLQTWAIATKSYDELIRSLMEVADFCRGSNDLQTSLDLLNQARRFSERQDDALLTAKVFEDLGKTYAALKQPQNQAAAATKRSQVLKAAITAGYQALEKLEMPAGVAKDAQAGLAKVAERGARACQEIRNYAKSAETWQRTVLVYKRLGDIDGQIRCLRALGTVLGMAKEPQQSLDARREAFLLARKSNQNSLAALIVQEMTWSFVELDELDNALEGFRELTPIIEEAGNIRGAAQVLEQRGKLLAKHAHPEEAIRDFDSARKRYLDQVGDVWSAARVALDLAQVQEAAGKPAEARTTLESAIQEIESAYGYGSMGIGSGEDRVATLTSLYRALLKNQVHAGDLQAATETVRKGRKHSWISKLVIEMRGDTTDAAAADWAKGVDVMAMDGPGPTMPGAGEKLVATDWASFTAACFWLERQHPVEYDALPIAPLALLKRRATLPEGLLVVEYLSAESSFYALIVGRDKSVCRQMNAKRGSVDELIMRLRSGIRSCEDSMGAGVPIPPMVTWQESSFLEIKEPLAGLFAQLIAPIAQDLAGVQRLAFALPDDLSGVPMHALVSSERNSVPRFMAEDYEISYLGQGMLSDLVGDGSRPIDPSADWLAIFADPEDSLPGAREEGAEVAAAYSTSRSYVGRGAATAAQFIAECKQANLLHIAAHHRVDPNPTGFQLLLAPSAGSDGTVGLQNMDFQNPYLQLVVLSACDSIGSADPISQAPARAAQVFSLVGAKSVLGGLWKVSDEAARKMMGAFYRGLSRGKSRAEALQSAQRAVIESRQFAHPFYWACLALYGNPR